MGAPIVSQNAIAFNRKTWYNRSTSMRKTRGWYTWSISIAQCSAKTHWPGGGMKREIMELDFLEFSFVWFLHFSDEHELR